MKRIQRTLVSVLLRSEFGILLLQRRLAYSEFLAVDFGSQVGVGLWELPGGGLDFGETLRRAGLRETREETGILVEQEDLNLAACCAYTLTGSGCESHRIHIIYEARVSAPSWVSHSNEHVAHQWVRDVGALQGLSIVLEVREVVVAAF
jgi:8-oxo-dGTP pyrophosphatase MutT (NUDIX family)